MGDETKPEEVQATVVEATADGEQEEAGPGCCSCIAGAEEADYWKTIDGEDRNCRDIFCCLLFTIFGLAFLGVFAWSTTVGDPYSLMYGRDYVGNICGATYNGDTTTTNPNSEAPGMVATSANMALYPNTLYPRINEDIAAQSDKFSQIATNPAIIFEMSFTGICVAQCPSKGTFMCEYATEYEINKQTTYSPAASHWSSPPTGDAATTEVTTAYNLRNALIKRCIDQQLFGLTIDAECTLNGFEIGKTCYSNALDLEPVFTYCLPRITTNSSSLKVCTDPQGIAFDDPRCKAWEVTDQRKYEAEPNPNPIFTMYTTVAGAWMKHFADVQKAILPILGFGILLPMVAGFVFIFILNQCVRPIVYVTIIIVILCLFSISAYALFKGGVITTDLINSAVSATGSTTAVTVPTELSASATYQTQFAWFGWIMLAITLIVIIIIVSQRRQIATACAIIQEGAGAMEAMPTMIFYPFSTVGQCMILFAMFLYGAMCIQSAGTLTVGDLTAQLESTTNMTVDQIGGVTGLSSLGNATLNSSSISSTLASYAANSVSMPLQGFQFFMFLWIFQYIQFFSVCCIAGAVVCWYENEGKEEAEKKALPWGLVFKFVPVTMMYYMGTVAFGACLVAIIQFLRAVAAYIQAQMEGSGEPNMVVKVIGYCVSCCLWCIEKCVKAISSNAYTLVMARNMSFCTAGYHAVSLMYVEIWCFAIAGVVTNMVIFLGKIFICVSCTLSLYLFLDNYEMYTSSTSATKLNSPMVPVILSGIFAYIMASCFLYIYEYTMNTILLLFLYYKNKAKTDAGKDIPPPGALAAVLGKVEEDAPSDMKAQNNGEPVTEAGSEEAAAEGSSCIVM